MQENNNKRLRRLAPLSILVAGSFLASVAVSGCSDDAGGAGAGGKGGAANTGGSAGKTSTTGGTAGTGGATGGNAGQNQGGNAGQGQGGAAGSSAGSAGQSQGGAAAGSAGKAGAGGGQPFVPCGKETTIQPIVVPVSDTGHDGFNGVTVGSDGSIYATGFVAAGTAGTDDRSTIVVKFDSAGKRVASFGTNGVATVNVVAAGSGEAARGIVLQSDGKIVVAGTVERDDSPTGLFVNDRNVYALRLNTDGTLDNTFGTAGIAKLDLNQGIERLNDQGTPQLLGADSQWGLSVYPGGDDRLVVFSSQRTPGFEDDGTTQRADSDFAVVRLTKNGALDSTFADNGKFTLDVARAGASARTTTVLADGSVVAAGYATYGGTQRPVIFKLTPAGKLDTTFGTQGIFSDIVGTAAEAYGAALQSDGKFVTAGYGRATPAVTATDFLSIRLTASGILDTTYGTSGKTWLDVGGFGDNARGITVLPDDRPVLIGVGRLTAANVDGAVAVLTPDGKPDTRFDASGCKVYDFGTPSDAITGVAYLSPQNQLVLVGGTGVATDSPNNNNAVLVLVPVPN